MVSSGRFTGLAQILGWSVWHVNVGWCWLVGLPREERYPELKRWVMLATILNNSQCFWNRIVLKWSYRYLHHHNVPKHHGVRYRRNIHWKQWGLLVCKTLAYNTSRLWVPCFKGDYLYIFNNLRFLYWNIYGKCFSRLHCIIGWMLSFRLQRVARWSSTA